MTESGRNKPNIPSWARPVDDTLATAKARGLMSPADKAKLDSLVPGVALTAADPLVIVGGTIDIKAATPTQEGSLAAADKAKLDGLVAGAQVNVLEDVTLTSTTTALVVTGGGAGGIVAKVKAFSLALASAVANGAAGLLTGADKAKLDGITALATPNLLESVSGTAPITAGAVTGKNQAIGITPATGSAAGSLAAADKTKLDALPAGAQVNVLESVSGVAPIVVAALAAKNQAISVNAATPSLPGVMSAADKAKLDSMGTGGSGVQYGTLGEVLLPDYTPHGATTGGGVGRYTRLAGPQQDAHLRSGAAAGSQAFVSAVGNANLGGNAYWDGTNWQRFDTAQAAVLFAATPLGLIMQRAAAGANPATLAALAVMDAGGGGDLQVKAPTNALMLMPKAANHLGCNVYNDGANWQRYDTSKSGFLLILRDNGDLEYYRFAAGANPIVFTLSYTFSYRTITPWTALAYTTNWGDFGSPQATGQYRVDEHGRVHLKGLAQKAVASVTNDIIAILPVGVRPAGVHVFGAWTSLGGAYELRVNSSGSIILPVPVGSSPPWVSLAAVAFDINT